MRLVSYTSIIIMHICLHAFSQDTAADVMVKDLKRGDFVKNQTTFKSLVVGTFISRKLNTKNLYDTKKNELVENPNFDHDQSGVKLSENDLWYVVTILIDHDALSNRRTFDIFKRTGECKYGQFAMQAKDIFTKYKPSSVFEVYAKQEINKPDSLVEDWIQHPEKYINPLKGSPRK